MALLGLSHHIINRELKSLHMYHAIWVFIYFILFYVLGLDFEKEIWFSSPKGIAMCYSLHLHVTY